ncbi:MAG: peptidyl-prolyl cis-trans isomerase [Oscillatoriales cyanobacterium C42_A2020_001]|nr:peptidyl-prolyl cis-trans isomerase [Leptolyngbyaceae cyanobacterium C42_A2020_001]
MTSPTFLTIDDEPISLAQAIHYLQATGRFQEFLLDILCQHALAKEVRSHLDPSLSKEALEQRLVDFRTQNNLISPNDFQIWLSNRGIDYETFRQQSLWNLSLELLREQINQEQFFDFFQQRKLFLDQVILSWIAVDTKDAILEVSQKLESGLDFDRLADAYASPDEDAYGVEEPFSREGMPEALKDAIASVEPGHVTQPVYLDDRWYIFRVEALITAELNDELKDQLETELFEHWLNNKVEAMTVKLEVN